MTPNIEDEKRHTDSTRSDEESGGASDEAHDGLQMAPELMLDLARRAAEFLVERIKCLPGENAWDGEFRQGLEDQLLEDPPEDGRPGAEVLERVVRDILPLTLRLDHPRSFAFIPSAPTWPGVLADFMAAGYNINLARPHSKSLSSVRFKVLRHGRTSLWLAGFGFQAAGAADEQVLSGHRRGLLHNTHICRCLEAYSSRGAFFSELQSGQIQAACSSSSRRRFFISMMRQKL